MSECFNGIISRLWSLETFKRNPTSLQFFSHQVLWRNFCKFLRSLPLLEKQWFWFFPTTRPRQVWLPNHCRQIPVQCSQTRRSRHHYAMWKKKQIMTKYLHKATSFYTETSRHLMITRKVSYTWRFVEVLSDFINFSWYPFCGLSFLEKG